MNPAKAAPSAPVNKADDQQDTGHADEHHGQGGYPGRKMKHKGTSVKSDAAKTKVSPVDIPTGWDPRTKQQRRVALADFSAAPWRGFEKSERGPNSSALFQPLAAVVAVALG